MVYITEKQNSEFIKANTSHLYAIYAKVENNFRY